MTKEITKAFVLQQIEDKFKLRELIPERFTFSEQVIPTYAIGEHLIKRAIAFNTVSIISGPLGYKFYSVPENEQWTIDKYDVVFMGAGAYTVTGVYYNRGETTRMMYLDMTIGQSVSYHVSLPVPLVLGPGSGLYVYVDSYTSTQSLRLYVDRIIEEIR